MNERLKRALWERQDGELSPEELVWLEERVAADPGARRQAERVAKLASRLDELPEEEPPVVLRRRIEEALEQRAGDRDGHPSFATGGFLSSISGKPWGSSLAYLAAGLVLGALAYHVVRGFVGPWSPGELEDLYGTMVPPADEDEAALRLPLAGDAGTLVLRGADPVLLVELTLRNAEPAVDLAVAGGGDVSVIAFSHESAARPDVRHREGTVRIVGLAEGRLMLWARVTDPDEPLEVEVSSAGETLTRSRFDLEDVAGSSTAGANFLPR